MKIRIATEEKLETFSLNKSTYSLLVTLLETKTDQGLKQQTNRFLEENGNHHSRIRESTAAKGFDEGPDVAIMPMGTVPQGYCLWLALHSTYAGFQSKQIQKALGRPQADWVPEWPVPGTALSSLLESRKHRVE